MARVVGGCRLLVVRAHQFFFWFEPCLLFSLSSYHFWNLPFVELVLAMLSSNLLIIWVPISLLLLITMPTILYANI